MNVSRFPVHLLGLRRAACEREGSDSLAPIAHGRTIRPGRVGHRGPVISADRRTHRLPPDFLYRNLRAGLARNRKIELCTAESTSYGISRPEPDLVACYLHAPLPSPDPTYVYAGLVSLEAPDTYINDEDGLYRQLLSQPACSFAGAARPVFHYDGTPTFAEASAGRPRH
jgi:hypothetical protein